MRLPSVPHEGEGLMYALRFRDNSVIRVLSPSKDPPVVEDEGSTAKTATRCFPLVRKFPKVSINVDFPPPGGPDKPILKIKYILTITFSIPLFQFKLKQPSDAYFLGENIK